MNDKGKTFLEMTDRLAAAYSADGSEYMLVTRNANEPQYNVYAGMKIKGLYTVIKVCAEHILALSDSAGEIKLAHDELYEIISKLEEEAKKRFGGGIHEKDEN